MTNDDYIKMCPEINPSSVWYESYLDSLWGIVKINDKYVFTTFMQREIDNLHALSYQIGLWPIIDQGNIKEIAVKDDYTFIHYEYSVQYRNKDFFVVLRNKNRVQGEVVFYGNYASVISGYEKPSLFCWRFV